MSSYTQAFSADDFLRLSERYGLIGYWGWNFCSNEHFWSPGLFRILGLENQITHPSYQLFLQMVHPEDRDRVETSSEVMEGVLRDHTFRVIRPDGSIRFLASRGEIYVEPDGRPRGAAGILADVSDREQFHRLRYIDAQHKRALFEFYRAFTVEGATYGRFEYPSEFFELTGLTPEAVRADHRIVVPIEERDHWSDIAIPCYAAGIPFVVEPLLTMANGDKERFRSVTVPIFNTDGNLDRWHHFISPENESIDVFYPDTAMKLEQQIRGAHIRAARGLLDWSRNDIAKASKVSVSTIRRLEDDSEAITSNNRHAVVSALRAAGVRFSLQGASILVGN